MALYLISYDITEDDEDEYEPLYEKLDEIGAERILESEWAVVDKQGRASTIYALLAPLITEEDHLLVQELGADSAWHNLLIGDAEFKAFLKKARR